jgi:hydrogenase expression/formation protein HypC
MCVAVPGKIVTIGADDMAVVDFGGVTRDVSLALLEAPQPGDYVIVHAGFALHKLDPVEAEETVKLMRQALAFDDPSA